MTNKINIPRIMIVGTNSGSGKTIITCGLLQTLVNRGLSVSSFKCGPDYIDLMFHSKIIGTKSRNLDLFMCEEKAVKYLFAKNSKQTDIAVIEGVMGMYDGLGGNSDRCSSNHLSLVTNTPEILVVNGKGFSLSLVALIKGYLEYKKNNIKGVIINNISKEIYPMYKNIVEAELGIKVYGFFPYLHEAAIESRHLGLVTADEIADIKSRLQIIANAVEDSIDIEGLLLLAKENSDFTYEDDSFNIEAICRGIKIGVAYDNAFCFIYEDNLDLLKELGCEIVYFSPLKDREIPKELSGLIFYGGYPEEYAKDLAQNKEMLKSVKEYVANKAPIIAECGGFMYLGQSITDRNGNKYEMAGVVNANFEMTKKLSRFGYIKLIANEDNLLCKKGDSIKAHEFHYSDGDNNGNTFTAAKKNRSWQCIINDENIFAGYPHFHFYANISFAMNFVKRCIAYKSAIKSGVKSSSNYDKTTLMMR